MSVNEALDDLITRPMRLSLDIPNSLTLSYLFKMDEICDIKIGIIDLSKKPFTNALPIVARLDNKIKPFDLTATLFKIEK